MATTSEDLRQQLNKSLEELKQLRDEIRVKLHLASMEAKTRWTQHLEPRFVEAEQHVKEAGEAARKALGEIIQSFKNFRSSMGDQPKDK